jgi:uncharacterized protein YoxC
VLLDIVKGQTDQLLEVLKRQQKTNDDVKEIGDSLQILKRHIQQVTAEEAERQKKKRQAMADIVSAIASAD